MPSQRQRQAITNVRIAKRGVWSLKEARDILTRLVGELRDWTALDSFLIDYLTAPEERATAIASSFAASLELVREGDHRSAPGGGLRAALSAQPAAGAESRSR